MDPRRLARDFAARSIFALSICLCCLLANAAISPAIAGQVRIAFGETAGASEIRALLAPYTDPAADAHTAEVVRFYRERNFQPAWTGSDEAEERARQVESALAHAGQQGLRSEDYPVGASAATFDVVMTASLLRYAHDVRTGRVDPTQVYRDVVLVPQQYDAATALSSAVQSNSIADYLADLPPTHPGYVGLVKALARYSKARQNRAAIQIAANMERWRWLPRSLESRYIAVDVPDQSLEYVRDGQPVLKSRVIIGRPDAQTPILRTTVQAVVANPPWDIPDDIAARMNLGNNPGAMASKNIVFENGQYRQNPGPDNGLGLVMLDMPNPFWVYLHDTPSKNLFRSGVREFSNGCVRVQEIFPLASLALTDDTATGLAQLQQAIDTGETQRLSLPSPLAVYMLYWTARADENGNVEFRPDRYGRDPPLMAALGYRVTSPAAETQRVSSVGSKPRPHKKSPPGQVSLQVPQKGNAR